MQYLLNCENVGHPHNAMEVVLVSHAGTYILSVICFRSLYFCVYN